MLIMAPIKAGFASLLLAVLASGCASLDATNAATGSNPQAAEEKGYITGSRLPRKASENTQGTRSVSPQDWERHRPPAGLRAPE